MKLHVSVFSAVLAWTAVHATPVEEDVAHVELHAETRNLIGHGVPTCNGQLVQRSIDFEFQRNAIPFRAGDIPVLLPDGVSVTAKRFHEARQTPPTDNDAIIIESYADFDEGLVLAINDSNDRSHPVLSRFGGEIKFKFDTPVFSVTNVRFLAVKHIKNSFVVGKTSTGGKTSKVEIPAGKKLRDVPLDFLDIKALTIKLRSEAAVARIDYSICIESRVECSDGEQLKNGSCRPCPVGKFSTGGAKCKKCPKGTFAPQLGSSFCQNCGSDEVSRKGQAQCLRCTGLLVPNNARSKCKLCRNGKEPVNNRVCRPCEPGFFSRNGNACNRCALNTVAPNKGMSVCTPCNSLQRSDPTNTVCINEPTQPPVPPPATAPPTLPPIVQCSPGTERVSNTFCRRCSIGTFSADGTACVRCPANTIAFNRGSSFCTPCGTGQRSDFLRVTCEDVVTPTPPPAPVPTPMPTFPRVAPTPLPTMPRLAPTPLPTMPRAGPSAPVFCPEDDRADSPSSRSSGSSRSGGKMGGGKMGSSSSSSSGRSASTPSTSGLRLRADGCPAPRASSGSSRSSSSSSSRGKMGGKMGSSRR